MQHGEFEEFKERGSDERREAHHGEVEEDQLNDYGRSSLCTRDPKWLGWLVGLADLLRRDTTPQD